MAAHEELERVYVECSRDPVFREELERLGRDFVGRPTPIYHAKRLSAALGGAQIWLKREELAHTGSHKLNNALGQALVAKRIGKKRIIAETGAGQHGVATATACALLGLECIVYMGEEDVRRQALNVFRMKILGARVIPVTSGSKTLKVRVIRCRQNDVINRTNLLSPLSTPLSTKKFPFPLMCPRAAGRHQRSHARLGDERAHDSLHHWHGHGPAPLPHDSEGLPERHWPGGEGTGERVQ